MAKQSAGLMVYTGTGDDLRVVIVHPSGAYNRNAAYSIPKGEPDEGEALEGAAVREVREETGIEITGPLVSLGHVDYTKSRKRVFAWAAELPPAATPACASWEIDRAELVSLDRAREVLHADQRVFVDRLVAALRSLGNELPLMRPPDAMGLGALEAPDGHVAPSRRWGARPHFEA